MTTIFNKELKEVVEEIAVISDWYYDKCHLAELSDIAKARDKLAVLNAYLSEWCARLGMEHGLAYISRKYLISTRVRDYVEMEKIAISLAKEKANTDSKLELETEKKKESESESVFLLHRATNNILNAMQQRISLLSKEKEAHRDAQLVDERVAEMKSQYDEMIYTLQERLDDSEVKYEKLVKRLAERFQDSK